MVWKAVLNARHGLVLLALAAFGAAPAAAQREIVTDEAYVHDPAHAVFPVRVGEFQRSDIFQYDKGGRDVSASYERTTSNGRLLVTVYIYPAAPAASAAARDRACDEEFDAVNAAISSQHGDAAPLPHSPALAVPGSAPDLRHRSIYRFRSPFGDRVQEIRSEAHLYCYVGGDWLVKYRVSAPVAVETRGPVEAFIRDGPWPGRSSS